MTDRKVEDLLAEVGTLEKFLQELPTGRVLERKGFELRLEEVKSELAELQGRGEAKRLPLTFRGAPVEGSRSIDATFATKAVRSFVEATDMVTASLVSEELKRTGPVPNLGGRSLRIVDRAIGSFGFELELPPRITDGIEEQPPLLLELEKEKDPYVDAIETTFALIRQAANLEEDDEALSELIAEIHPRAARKVRDFAVVLADHDALFAAEFNGQRIRLDESAELDRVLRALKEEDISESDLLMKGVILGILPDSRQFEVRFEEDQKVIRGKVDRGIEEIASFKQEWEGRAAELEFRTISVRTKKQYVLVGARERK